MKRVKLIGVPVCLLVILSGWLVYDSLRAKHRLNAQYALPADTNPRAMLDFMRKMEGSTELSQGLVRSDNAREICTAVLAACEYVPDNSPQLTPSEQREVQFYRVKYAGGAIIRGFVAETHATIEKLVDDAKNVIASAEVFGSREQAAAEMTLRILEGSESNIDTLGFISWLSEKLSFMKSNPEKDAFATRLERIATRLELTHSQLALQSLTLAGETFDIQSLRGKVVLVEFWGTRCQPCIADFPALKRIYGKYSERGFEIVGICLNSEPERIRRCADEHNLPWLQLCHDPSGSMECNQSLSDRFGIEAVPTTLLINPTGQVLTQGVRPLHSDPERDLEKQLEQMLPGQ
jgi:peroxiredoxin